MGYPRVTPEEVKKIYQLYKKHGSYAEVARLIGRSPSTVARYIKAGNLKALSTAGKQSF